MEKVRVLKHKNGYWYLFSESKNRQVERFYDSEQQAINAAISWGYIVS
jgi:hypothetical protein